MSRIRWLGSSPRRLIRDAAGFLLGSSKVRRLGRLLPQRWRDLARSKAGLDQRARALSEHVRARLLASNQTETAALERIRTRTDWEAFRDVRIDALRRSLGDFPQAPRALQVRATRTRTRDGFYIENLVLESRPGLLMTANMYRPSEPTGSMAGILICHSHHRPKTDDELQNMGATWARCGCTVLVMDQLCHGERRQHPFRSAADYRGRFLVGRQDYFFRYNVGMQLHLIGDCLIGWMVWDLMRGVDLLLGQPGVDPARIILIGSVASGGDPAAVAAALDQRIAAVIPFGFGKGRTLGVDSDIEIDFVGSGSWESTRNLRLSARDGFAPWVILGAVADRRLVYAHEFAWEPEDDPAWERIVEIYDLYGASDRLAAVHGSGSVTGSSPRDTHCSNVGLVHRRQIDTLLERWFGVPAPVEEPRARCRPEELVCRTPETSLEFDERPVHELAAELGAERIAAARKRRSALDTVARCAAIKRDLSELLGAGQPAADPRVVSRTRRRVGGVDVELAVLEVEPGIPVPTVLLRPAPREESTRPPVVIGAAQEGNQQLLHGRADLVSGLLRRGAAVCLAELRGTGDSGRGDEYRGRRSAATAVSSGELMLGRTLLGMRLRDLRSVLRHLRNGPDVDATRVVLWGDSFSPPNPPASDLAVPFDAEPFPALCEPLGGLVALLGGLFEPEVRAVYLRGGLTAYASLLESPFCYVPHDVIVPGVMRVGDVCDVAAALAPRALWMEALVDGRNCLATAGRLAEIFQTTRAAYREAGARERLRIQAESTPAEEIAQWILTGIE